MLYSGRFALSKFWQIDVVATLRLFWVFVYLPSWGRSFISLGLKLWNTLRPTSESFPSFLRWESISKVVCQTDKDNNLFNMTMIMFGQVEIRLWLAEIWYDRLTLTEITKYIKKKTENAWWLSLVCWMCGKVTSHFNSHIFQLSSQEAKNTTDCSWKKRHLTVQQAHWGN